MNVSIFVIVIGSFFILRSECFLMPASLSYICSTVLQTVFVLFASQLTAPLPFSMRTASSNYHFHLFSICFAFRSEILPSFEIRSEIKFLID